MCLRCIWTAEKKESKCRVIPFLGRKRRKRKKGKLFVSAGAFVQTVHLIIVRTLCIFRFFGQVRALVNSDVQAT